MHIRLTNGMVIGLAVGLMRWDAALGILVTACIEVLSCILVLGVWAIHGYRPITRGSFMASLIFTNTPRSSKDFAYQVVLARIFFRGLGLVGLLQAPELWPMFITTLIITILYQ